MTDRSRRWNVRRPLVGALLIALILWTGPAALGQGETLVTELSPVELYSVARESVVSVRVYAADPFGTPRLGSGSGFIYDERGHIVTNHHVVDGAQRIVVVFSDGFETLAEIVGTDPHSDLAVLRADELPRRAPALLLGDSDRVKVGQTVAAIGNPFGLGGSMSIGIVSAVGRTIASGATPFGIPLAIQTDAAINPGNSGGPLLNALGEVIGINAQIATGGETGSAGVGFAIPSRVVDRVVPALIERGDYSWPWLGVSGQSVDLFIREANRLSGQRGAYIHTVIASGPAGEAGIRGSTDSTSIGGIPVPVGGDVILAIDSVLIETFDELLETITFRRPGDRVRLTILRDGEQTEMVAVLQARPVDL